MNEFRKCVYTDKRRFLLQIHWDKEKKPLIIVGLNPANNRIDDNGATIKMCKYIANKNSYGGVIIFNLFSICAPDSRKLQLRYLSTTTVPEPVNIVKAIKYLVKKHKTQVLAVWGNTGTLHNKDKQFVCQLSPIPVYCLGKNKNKTPKHPVHMSKKDASILKLY